MQLNVVKKTSTPEPASTAIKQPAKPAKKKIAGRIVNAAPENTAPKSDAAPAQAPDQEVKLLPVIGSPLQVV